MADQPNSITAIVVIAGTLAVLALHAFRWRAGRASGTELLGHAGFTVVLLAGSTAVLTGVV